MMRKLIIPKDALAGIAATMFLFCLLQHMTLGVWYDHTKTRSATVIWQGEPQFVRFIGDKDKITMEMACGETPCSTTDITLIRAYLTSADKTMGIVELGSDNVMRFPPKKE